MAAMILRFTPYGPFVNKKTIGPDLLSGRLNRRGYVIVAQDREK
jgi:hypothetical protein